MREIEHAARLAVATLAKIIPLIRPGVSEKQIAAEIKKHLKPSFRIIVASGKRSALPHGFATNKKLQRGDLVVIDFGAVYNGYRSDISRTFIVGRDKRRNKRQKRLIEIVKKAQAQAIKAVRAGRRCCEIDRAAREYITKQGLGKQFVHSAGHGIGKKVHEAPKISFQNRRKLKAGTVVTIEPGIYIGGWGGIRIEDMVLVTKQGCRVLTK